MRNERTPITEFCTSLTGISDATLEGAGTLEDALRLFNAAMSEPSLAGRRCCAVAHGSADLELTLPSHCKASGLAVPKALRKYVDLREAAQRHVATSGNPGRRASTLKEICTSLGVEMLGNEHCGLDDSWMVLLSLQQLLKAKADLIPVDIDEERENFFSRGNQQELCFDGLPFFTVEPEVRRWLVEKTQQSLDEGALSVVLGSDGRPSGRAIADFGTFEAAIHALKALENGRAILTGTWDGAPHGSKERIVLARPLRQQERDLLGQSVVPFPAGPQALAVLRERAKGAGKGRGQGVCFQGRNCVRASCHFAHPDGRAIDAPGAAPMAREDGRPMMRRAA